MEDPNPKTRGGGFARLRVAGIEVEIGVLEADAQRLNEAFAHWITTKKPFVTLKSALTLDGQLALPRKHRTNRDEWITGEESRAQVHRMRHASDALLTGIGTILADDPLLTDRSGLERRRKLLRVVLDTKLRLPLKSRIVQTADDDLLVVTAAPLKARKARKLQNLGIEVLKAKATRGKIRLGDVLRELGKREILSVLLEAGPQLNTSAVGEGVVQKLVFFFAPKFAGTVGVPLLHALAVKLPSLHISSVRQFGADVAIELSLKR
jgi:diaminohydroxyphosphoribosylaminopyrimidine deaminase/5-amino-6-(5-phosphoribosylamino)uracil reductase